MAILEFLFIIGYFAHSASGLIAKDALESPYIAVKANCGPQLFVALKCCHRLGLGVSSYEIMCSMHRDPDNNNNEQEKRCDHEDPSVQAEFVPLEHCLTTDGKLQDGVRNSKTEHAIPTCQIVPSCRMDELQEDTVFKVTKGQLEDKTDWSVIGIWQGF